MTPLSAHFTVEEMELSQDAVRNGIDNTAPPEVLNNLQRLCLTVLEPLRAKIERPIVVSSGYRCLYLNSMIGGDPKSDHMLGLAADIVAPPMSVHELFAMTRSLAAWAPIKKVIIEFGRWVHVSALPIGVVESPLFLVATRGEDGKVHYSEA